MSSGPLSLAAHPGSADPSLHFGTVIGLAAAAFAAGAINSVAGGGSFITFPALLACGVPPVRANTTNTVAVWFGSLASVGAYRRQLHGQRRALITLVTTSLIGGLVGALLLLATPDATFSRLLPWLMLTATLIFIFGRHVTAFVRRRVHLDLNDPRNLAPYLAGCVLQLVIAVYGGFFGGGIGILMLALLTLLGYEEMHVMNALKTVLATVINGIAVVAFVIAGAVAWPQALVMTGACVAGGYGGAVLAQRIPAAAIRGVVMAVGIGMTIYFFARPYL